MNASSARFSPFLPPRRGGFTLVELLAVVALIIIMIGIAANVAQNLGRGQGLDNAVSVLKGQVDSARALALARGTDTRLLIVNKQGTSDEDADRYRNYLVVVYRTRTDNGSGSPTYQWVADGNGISMPSGVRFSTEHSAGWLGFDDSTQNLGDTNLSISRAFNGFAPGDWISYGFDASGTPVNARGTGDRLDLIIQANAGIGASGEITVRAKNRNQVGGVAITRYGNTLPFRDAKHVSDITGTDFISQ